jgi:hypothetical protein
MESLHLVRLSWTHGHSQKIPEVFVYFKTLICGNFVCTKLFFDHCVSKLERWSLSFQINMTPQVITCSWCAIFL